MIAHQYPGMHPSTLAAVRLFQQIRPREPILVIIENILFAIPTGHHVVAAPTDSYRKDLRGRLKNI